MAKSLSISSLQRTIEQVLEVLTSSPTPSSSASFSADPESPEAAFASALSHISESVRAHVRDAQRAQRLEPALGALYQLGDFLDNLAEGTPFLSREMRVALLPVASHAVGLLLGELRARLAALRALRSAVRVDEGELEEATTLFVLVYHALHGMLMRALDVQVRAHSNKAFEQGVHLACALLDVDTLTALLEVEQWLTMRDFGMDEEAEQVGDNSDKPESAAAPGNDDDDDDDSDDEGEPEFEQGDSKCEALVMNARQALCKLLVEAPVAAASPKMLKMVLDTVLVLLERGPFTVRATRVGDNIDDSVNACIVHVLPCIVQVAEQLPDEGACAQRIGHEIFSRMAAMSQSEEPETRRNLPLLVMAACVSFEGAFFSPDQLPHLVDILKHLVAQSDDDDVVRAMALWGAQMIVRTGVSPELDAPVEVHLELANSFLTWAVQQARETELSETTIVQLTYLMNIVDDLTKALASSSVPLPVAELLGFFAHSLAQAFTASVEHRGEDSAMAVDDYFQFVNTTITSFKTQVAEQSASLGADVAAEVSADAVQPVRDLLDAQTEQGDQVLLVPSYIALLEAVDAEAALAAATSFHTPCLAVLKATRGDEASPGRAQVRLAALMALQLCIPLMGKEAVRGFAQDVLDDVLQCLSTRNYGIEEAEQPPCCDEEGNCSKSACKNAEHGCCDESGVCHADDGDCCEDADCCEDGECGGKGQQLRILPNALEELIACFHVMRAMIDVLQLDFLPYLPTVTQALILFAHSDEGVIFEMVSFLGALPLVFPPESHAVRGEPHRFHEAISDVFPALAHRFAEELPAMPVSIACATVESISKLVQYGGALVVEDLAANLQAYVLSVLDRSAAASPEYFQWDPSMMEWHVRVCTLVGKLALALGPDFLPLFEPLAPLYHELCEAAAPPPVRNSYIGTLGDIAEGLQGSSHPLTPTWINLISAALDPTGDLRLFRNAAYAGGVVAVCGGDEALEHLPNLVGALQPMLELRAMGEDDDAEEDEPFSMEEKARIWGAQDNAVSALAKLMLHAPSTVIALPQAVPLFLSCIPLKDDLEENVHVYGCLAMLLDDHTEAVVAHRDVLASAISAALSDAWVATLQEDQVAVLARAKELL